MATYCISDLHLGEDPNLFALFTTFLDSVKPNRDALFILGDLFELWIGDDLMTSAQQAVVNSLRSLTLRGVPVYFLKGNRDFLIGETFLAKTGAVLLDEPAILQQGGKRILLCHGDTLCLSDIPYQRFRRIVRNRLVQAIFNRLPKPWRKQIATSFQQKGMADRKIIDITPASLPPLQQQYQADVILHGHTHLPAIHLFTPPSPQQHLVLSDWGTQGQYALITETGTISLHFFDQNTTPAITN